MIGSVLLLAGALQVASGESVRAGQIADRYGAQADITFTVVDTAGKGVAGVRLKARNSIDLDLTTDANGVARYRGVAWKDLNVAVSGEGDLLAVLLLMAVVGTFGRRSCIRTDVDAVDRRASCGQSAPDDADFDSVHLGKRMRTGVQRLCHR